MGPSSAGPPSEEIYIDDHGRVKVRFHWDRDKTSDPQSSCWIRVSQSLAGAGWGGLSIPRVGQEVLVSYIEGDPDRPIITGRVYNGVQKIPYGPKNKTYTTIKSNSSPGGGGFNEIRFEDKAGSEDLFIHAQKDRTEETQNDLTAHVGNNLSETVDQTYKQTIGDSKDISVGGDHTETIAKKMELAVGTFENHTVGDVYNQTVGGAKQVIVGSGSSEQVTGAKSQSIGASKNTKVGGSYREKISKDRTIKVGGTNAEDVEGTSQESIKKDKIIQAENIALCLFGSPAKY